MSSCRRRSSQFKQTARGWTLCLVAGFAWLGLAAPATAGSWVYGDSAARHNSVFVFGGRMSTGDWASTSIFNQNYSDTQRYDNSIAGAAYDRDVYDWGGGWLLRGEVGFADRFGHYKVCCGTGGRDATQISSSELNSYEFWFGPQIRREGIALGDTVRMSVAVTGGFSYVTSSIGREQQREIDYDGQGHLLFYGAYEFGFSLTGHPNVELVYRLTHRSGLNGTLGNMREGYNANVLGLRYRF